MEEKEEKIFPKSCGLSFQNDWVIEEGKSDEISKEEGEGVGWKWNGGDERWVFINGGGEFL